MSVLPTAIGDPARLDALERYAILDTRGEAGFDDIVQLACQLCAVPMALVSLVAGDRQWFKARVGFSPCETDLNSSVCAHALDQPDRLMVIPDLTADPRTRTNPLVTGEPFIRFYAGAPLVTPDGQTLGSLCVIDRAARPDGLTRAQGDGLMALARQVMTQMELRRAIRMRDELRLEERRTFEARDALRETQAALAVAADDLGAILSAVVAGAMRAVPAARGGVVELIDGGEVEFRETQGALARHRGLRLPLEGTLAGHCATSRAPRRIADARLDPHVRRDMSERLELRSAIVAPLLRRDGVLGILKLQSGERDAFTDIDLATIGLFAGAATAALSEADAHAAARGRDTYWRGLFDRLNEGFIVGELVRDAGGRGLDWRYLEVNPAWDAIFGTTAGAVVGRTVRETFPGIEDEWVDEVVRVVDAGRPASFTREIGALRRWFEGRAFPLCGDRFGIIFLDVTARIEADERGAALLRLGDRLRDLTTTPEMTRAAAEIVGRTLRATRAGFGRLEGDVEVIEIEPDWTAPGMESIAGRHRLDDYGDFRGHLRRGEPLVIDDVATDPRTSPDPASMQTIGVASMVNMPVRERGRTVAVFFVHDAVTRTWTAEELAFLRNVADRVGVGVARVRAEDHQSVLNHELAHRLKNTLAIVQSMAVQSLRGVTERDLVQSFDRRVLALSRAHDALLQKSWSAARMRALMESVLTLQTDIDRFALDGPDLDIGPQAAMSLSMLLHELTTNALKYGALSSADGRVCVSWRTEPQGTPTLVLDWRESGGPTVEAPRGGTGFGSKLIRMGLLGSRKAELCYEPLGLRAEFRAPLKDMQAEVH